MEINDIGEKLRRRPIHGLTGADHRRHLRVLNLSKVPVFLQVVARLNKGQSAAVVTRWFQQQDASLQGHLAGQAYESIRTLVTALAVEMDELRTHYVEPRSRMESVSRGTPPPKPGALNELDEILVDVIRNYRAMQIEQYSFAIQKKRVEKLMEQEKSLGFLLPFGFKEIKIMSDIGERISSAEIRDVYAKQRAMFMGIGTAEPKLSPIMQEVAKLSPSERHLFRDACMKVVDMVQEEGLLGPYARLKAEQDGAAGTEKPSS